MQDAEESAHGGIMPADGKSIGQNAKVCLWQSKVGGHRLSRAGRVCVCSSSISISVGQAEEGISLWVTFGFRPTYKNKIHL